MKKVDRYDSLFQYYAKDSPINWLWYKAQAMQESAMDPKAVSHAGARGLTQFMPATWLEITGKKKGWRNPEKAIKAQVKYMEQLYKYFDKNLDKAIAAYNAGMGRIKRLGENWKDEMPQETKTYLSRIVKLHKRYMQSS